MENQNDDALFSPMAVYTYLEIYYIVVHVYMGEFGGSDHEVWRQQVRFGYMKSTFFLDRSCDTGLRMPVGGFYNVASVKCALDVSDYRDITWKINYYRESIKYGAFPIKRIKEDVRYLNGKI